MDSTGLHALVAIKRAAAEVGSELVLVRLSRSVERLLELTGTSSYFRTDPE